MKRLIILAALALASPAHAFEAVTALPMHPYANAAAQAFAAEKKGCKIAAPKPGDPLLDAAFAETKALSPDDSKALFSAGALLAMTAIDADISFCATIDKNVRALTAKAEREGF